jgi:Zn-dependent peptidase ImmA (M78 family)/DNA-binding XRE family transcriptional regulator
MAEFNPRRLSIARKRRLLNQKGFAERIGIAAHTVSRCEKGLHVPTAENIEAFARVLGFPREFFFGADLDEPEARTVSFRSQKAMTAATRDAALAAGALGFLLSDYVETLFDLPPSNVPDLHLYEPETAARMLRHAWLLGERPISNMVHLLESKGVRVLSLAENSKHVNAFSVWRDNKAYVFLNTMKSSENSRFDAAHELAHLTLHQDGKMTGREAEDQANAFASAFLMPRSDVLAVLPRVHSLDKIVREKKRWLVSVAALNYRLHKINITSEWKYRDLCIQIAQHRYNVMEPFEIDRERSIIWQKVMTALWREKTTQKDIARKLNLPQSEVDTLIFGVLHTGGHSRPEARDRLSIIE